MKFIIDAQLPKSLSEFLKDNGYDSIHTLELPDKNKTTDKKIIEIAIRTNRIVVSKDYDFLESFLLKSEPTKLIMVKTGNVTNNKLLEIFNNNLSTIVKMISQSNLVEISNADIAER